MARGLVDFSEYDETAYLTEQQKLYEALRGDSTCQSSGDPILDSFYLAMSGSEQEGIAMTNDELIKLLSDTTLHDDTTAFNEQLALVTQANNDINGTELATQNTKRINDIYLNLIRMDADLLSQIDYDFVETLANACPYLDGEAVYRARSLMGIYQPGLNYEDRPLCAAVGIFKNGNTYSAIDSLLMKEQDELAKLLINNSHIIVYPNPAQEQVMVRYQLEIGNKAIVELIDMTGRKVLTAQLVNNQNEISIDIRNLLNGIYTYRYLVDSKVNSTGKLNISK